MIDPGSADRQFMPYMPVYAVVALCVLIEIVLSLADHGFILTARARATVYEYGGFWPGLLRGWQPNFPAQPALMFLTYSFLHAGLWHLFVNMFTLVSFGRIVCDRARWRGFLLVYVASILGGSVVFGLFAPTLRPMVGASGALFGLIGAVLAWAYVDLSPTPRSVLPVWRAVGILIVLNVVLLWAMKGQLAWQTHLGGFLAGAATAVLIDRRPRKPG